MNWANCQRTPSSLNSKSSAENPLWKSKTKESEKFRMTQSFRQSEFSERTCFHKGDWMIRQRIGIFRRVFSDSVKSLQLWKWSQFPSNDSTIGDIKSNCVRYLPD
jgi:hypothetical protein